MEPKLFIAKLITGETVCFEGSLNADLQLYIATKPVISWTMDPYSGNCIPAIWFFGHYDNEEETIPAGSIIMITDKVLPQLAATYQKVVELKAKQAEAIANGETLVDNGGNNSPEEVARIKERLRKAGLTV